MYFLLNTYTYGQYYLDLSQLFTQHTGWSFDSPITGAVYQRGVDNKATIKVKGYFRTGPNFDLSRTVTIAGELKPLDLLGNELQVASIPVPITTLTQNLYYNNYSGTLTVPSGWYKLQLKAIASPNAQTLTTLTSWVGVGEVFIIAGQSNAQGLPNNSGQNDKVANNPQPTLDAVRVQPYQFETAKYLGATDPTSIGITSNMQVQRPYLSNLISGKDAYNNPNSGIAPLGNSLWYWVALGEKIAQEYNVPVAFFNAAWGGTNIKAWQESTNPAATPWGQPTSSGTGTYAPGAPYGYFKNALKFYGSTYGVRSVLWLQGETDAQALRGGENWARQRVLDANDYAQKLTQVINQSRQDLKNELTWMVGKASFIEGVWYDAGTPEAQSAITVRQGQEQVISSGLIKRGPDIDQIKERATGPGEPTHLTGAGLWKAANAWFDAIQSSNLLISTPITPQSLGTEPREFRLDANGTITTPLPSGSQYIWYRGNSGNGGRIDLNAPAGYGPTMPTNITDPLVIIQDSQGNYTLGTLVLPDLSAPSTGNGNGLLGNYFNNTSLSGSAALSRTESTINFTWDGGGSSPFPGVSASNMSARWEGQVEAPVDGQYTFSTNNDDATNLWVNGQQLINDWPGGHGAIIKSGVITLQAGQKYSIKLEFNQGVGGAQAQLLWSYPGQGQQIIPQGRLYSNGTPPTNPSTGGGNGNGLSGNYFNNTNLSGSPVLSRTESTINFTWDGGGSSPFPGVSASNMSARWEGQVEAPVDGQYTFSTNNDDATNLWVNGQQLINDWPGGHGAIIKSGVITLQAGQKYSIKLEFNQGVGGAQAQLLWSYPGQGQQIIPQGRLYSNGITPTNPPVETGSLAFQIVSYDCNSGVLQYKFSSNNNAVVNVTMPGIFGGTMSPNTVASTTFPGDAKVGRTVTGTASQSGNQININFTTSCNLTTTTTTPPTGNCNYTEGQYLFTTSWGEVMYAHFYNGVLYAAYQDGSNFRPQHWLVATGQMTSTVANCFAENDPHSSGGRVAAIVTNEPTSEADFKLTIYPNPNNGHFEISIPVVQGQTYTLQVMDLLGHVVMKRDIVSKGPDVTEPIDLPNLNLTSVIVQVKSGLNVARKVVVIHK